MSKRLVRTWMGSWLLATLLLSLVACGGGDGDGDESVKISMEPSADQTMVEGNTPTQFRLTGKLDYSPSVGDFYIVLEGDTRLLADASGNGSESDFYLSLQYAPNLPAGEYTSTLTVHACSDKQCKHELGHAVQVPLTLHVLPNIQVQSQIFLTRTGREAAPSLTVPVTVPAAAGAVNFSSNIANSNALAISFDGSALHVDTQQVRAGTYTTTATLQSDTDSRYSRTVTVEYTVLPPEGGERAMAVTPAGVTTLAMPQGSQTVQQIRVTRPTWTSAWNPPVLTGSNPEMATLRDLGDDVYEVTISTADKPAGYYDVAVTFDAGPTGGIATAPFFVEVQDIFALTYVESIEVHSDTPLSALVGAIPVTMVDSSKRRWIATSTSPYVHFTRSTGMTGVDSVSISLDPALLELPDGNQSLPISVSVDVPGSLPLVLDLTVVNRIPRLRRAVTHTLVSPSGRAYVQGLYDGFEGGNWRDRLQVSGATLVQAEMLADVRFLGTQAVLALDLANLVPGQNVTVRYNSVLAPSQVQFQVQAPLTSEVTVQSLPYDLYRPGQFSQGLAALYFAGKDKVFRWNYAAGHWALSQATIPGVIDLAPSPDESVVYATGSSLLWALQPQTFAVQATGDLTLTQYFPTWQSFESAASSKLQGWAFSADGRALSGVYTPRLGHGVAWICSSIHAEAGLTLLTTDLATCDPGTGGTSTQGFGITRSPNGHTVVAVSLGGEHRRYRAADRDWTDMPRLPAGVQVVAVSDDGARWVRSDGLLIDATGATGNLGSALPAGYEPGGYGLSAAGGYGLVYGYRRTGAGAAERATDAKVWIVDLSQLNATGITSASVLDSVSLPQALGCTETFASGETCAHQASITVAPGQRTAFVIGPRGVAALPLPSGAAETQGLRKNRNRTTLRAANPSTRQTLRRSTLRIAAPTTGNVSP